jgi:hypothetical protein
MSESEDDALDMLAGLDIGSDEDEDDLLDGFDVGSDEDEEDVVQAAATPAPGPAPAPAPAAAGAAKPSVSEVLAKMRAQREEARLKMAETIQRTAVSAGPAPQR